MQDAKVMCDDRPQNEVHGVHRKGYQPLPKGSSVHKFWGQSQNQGVWLVSLHDNIYFTLYICTAITSVVKHLLMQKIIMHRNLQQEERCVDT